MATDPQNLGQHRIEVLQGAQPLNAGDDNVDVYVYFSDGRTYFATFYTLDCIRRLMATYHTTGECDSGKYFWSVNMVIIDALTEARISDVVANLIKQGEFCSAFGLVQRVTEGHEPSEK